MDFSKPFDILLLFKNYSERHFIPSGILQGSIRKPLLFLIKSEIKLFADDVKIFVLTVIERNNTDGSK